MVVTSLYVQDRMSRGEIFHGALMSDDYKDNFLLKIPSAELKVL